MYDNTNDMSWGGRVIVKTNINGYPYILFGHLDENRLPKVGDILQKGETIGYLGQVGKNGTWFKHLHIQQMSQLFIDFFSDELENIDGYGQDPSEDFSKIVCDPITLLIIN